MYRVYIQTLDGEEYTNVYDFDNTLQAHGYLWEHSEDDDFKSGRIMKVDEIGKEHLFYE